MNRICIVGQFEHARLESNGKPFIEDLGEPKNSFGNFEASQLQSRLFTPSESSLFPSPPVFAPVQFEPQEESSNFGYQPLASIDDEVSHLTGVENSTHLGSAAPDQQLLDFPPPPVSRTDPFLAALNGLITPVQPGPSVPQSQERNFANSIFPQQQQQQQQMDQFWGNLMKILIGKKKRKKK